MDAVLEHHDRWTVGAEVKRAASVSRSDLHGLKSLMESANTSFHLGPLLYGGRETLPFGEKILAVPIAALWR